MKGHIFVAKQAAQMLASRPRDTSLIYGADLLFFVCYAVIHTLTVMRAIPHFQAISALVAENGAALSPLADGSVAGAFPVDVFRAEFLAIILLALVLLASTFVLFCLLEGFAWWKTQGLAETKVPSARYLARFASLALAWSAAAAIVGYASIQISSLDMIVGLFGSTSWIGEVIIGAAVLAISYLAAVGFSLCAAYALRDTLRRIWTVRMLVPFFTALGLIVASVMVLWALNLVSPILVVPGFLLATLPAIMYGRMLIVVSGKKPFV